MEHSLTHEVVTAATGRAELAAALRPPTGTVDLPSALPVAELAAASVGAASLAAEALAQARRTGAPARPGALTPVALDGARVSAAYRGEQVFTRDGVAPDAWAPASGFFETAAGWVRTHGNYPHHAAALRRLLGLPEQADRADVATALRAAPAEHWEDRAPSYGAVLGRVRTEAEWQEHPHAVATRALPLVRREIGQTAAPPLRGGASGPPLAGVRVLDLTRVIAGPVATRTLALFGAQVLRIDPPRLREIEWQYLDTGQGKRSTLLELEDPAGARTVESLLARADVLVTGYRPGALARFGLDSRSIRTRHPHVITAAVDAWGPGGPWEGRRGFDSIVQAVSGIAVLQGTDAAPGALPAQALDHTAGYVLAAAVMSALEQRHLTGAVAHLGVSLARVAQTLLAAPRVHAPLPAASGEPWRESTVEIPLPTGGAIRCARPAPVFEGRFLDYPGTDLAYAAAAPAW